MHMMPDMQRWSGRIDAEEGELGRRWHQLVRPLTEDTREGVALLGFACDAGVARNHGRTGAAGGPAAIRAALGNMPVRRCRAIADAGDVLPRQDADGDGLEAAQDTLSSVVAGLLGRGLAPVVLGGGHEMALGSFGGLARHLWPMNNARIGIINFDAHFDLRLAAQASSGTPFRQIAEYCEERGRPFDYCVLGISEFANTEALFARARALGVRWMLDEALQAQRLAQAQTMLQDFLAAVDHVYLTICLDVLPAAVAPGVSAPAARGVPLEVIEPLLDLIAASGKLRVSDIAELNPRHDIDQRTARVAARLVARLAERWTQARG